MTERQRTLPSGFAGALLFVAALAADILTKRLALDAASAWTHRPDDGFIALALHFNRGAAFSLFRAVPNAALLLSVAGAALLLFTRIKFAAKPAKGVAWPLLFAGAAGNMLDRLLNGYVVDWLRVGPLHVNAADLFLCIGGVLLLLRALRR